MKRFILKISFSATGRFNSDVACDPLDLEDVALVVADLENLAAAYRKHMAATYPRWGQHLGAARLQVKSGEGFTGFIQKEFPGG